MAIVRAHYIEKLAVLDTSCKAAQGLVIIIVDRSRRLVHFHHLGVSRSSYGDRSHVDTRTPRRSQGSGQHSHRGLQHVRPKQIKNKSEPGIELRGVEAVKQEAGRAISDLVRGRITDEKPRQRLLRAGRSNC